MTPRQANCRREVTYEETYCDDLVKGNSVAEIRVQPGEPIDNALRRFKRAVQSEDIIREVKRHSYFLKPGEKRRVKQALARKRARKKIRKETAFVKGPRRDSAQG